MTAPRGWRDLRRLLATARPAAGRLTLAATAGAAALLASVGLTATAAWLIARASQQPPVLTLTVAVVAVRFFGVARPVLRYAERLVSHDAAFRLLRDLRAAVYERLVPLTPARLGAGAGESCSRASSPTSTPSRTCTCASSSRSPSPHSSPPSASPPPPGCCRPWPWCSPSPWASPAWPRR